MLYKITEFESNQKHASGIFRKIRLELIVPHYHVLFYRDIIYNHFSNGLILYI